MDRNDRIKQYQNFAVVLRQVVPSVQQLYHEQFMFLSTLSVHNVLGIDAQQRQIQILNHCFHIQFYPPTENKTICVPQFMYKGHYAESLEEFCLHDIVFWVGEQTPQHSLYLRNKVKQLRQLLLQQVFVVVGGLSRIQTILTEIEHSHAELFQQLCQYVGRIELSATDNNLLTLLEQLCYLDADQAEDILPIQSLMHSYDELCFSAKQFLEPHVYRIVETAFPERFCLQELIDHGHDISLLYPHAKEQPELLGFARLMNRDLWSLPDLLAKQHFLEVQTKVWQKKVAKLPIFDEKRTVNWLFKQKAVVTDWVSHNIQHSSVRVAVTALSYLDTQSYHPEIILVALRYFQHVAARLFIQSCYEHAIEQQWFELEANQHVVLKNRRQDMDDQRIAISPSILYLDEWLELLHRVVQQQPEWGKKVYTKLSRVMQAYIQHLDKIAQKLPVELAIYFSEENQQHRDFYRQLQQYKLPIESFRQLFYLNHPPLRVSVFDAYVRDYLPEHFETQKDVLKNVTWNGLFHQAVQWHDQLHSQELLAELKRKVGHVSWQPISHEAYYFIESWVFEELKDIDRIIAESRRFRHCLAASFAERIIVNEYVAFHMSHTDAQRHLTLGCYYIAGQLLFDQLEYPNNQKALPDDVLVAEQFIAMLNQERQEGC